MKQVRASAPVVTVRQRERGTHARALTGAQETGRAAIALTVSDARGQPSVNSREIDCVDPASAIAGPAAKPRRFGRILGECGYGLLEP